MAPEIDTMDDMAIPEMLYHDSEDEYDHKSEMERNFEYIEEQQKELERRVQLDELRRQVDELKEQMYERTAIDRSEHQLLERFDYMMRGRFISEPVAHRMIEIIRDRMERSPTSMMEQKLRELQAEQYMMAMNKYRIQNPCGEVTLDDEKIEFIEKGEMEV